MHDEQMEQWMSKSWWPGSLCKWYPAITKLHNHGSQPFCLLKFNLAVTWDEFCSQVLWATFTPCASVLSQQPYIWIPHIPGWLFISCASFKENWLWVVSGAHLFWSTPLYLPLKLSELCFYSSWTLGFWVKSFTLIKPSGPILFGKKIDIWD